MSSIAYEPLTQKPSAPNSPYEEIRDSRNSCNDVKKQIYKKLKSLRNRCNRNICVRNKNVQWPLDCSTTSDQKSVTYTPFQPSIPTVGRPELSTYLEPVQDHLDHTYEEIPERGHITSSLDASNTSSDSLSNECDRYINFGYQCTSGGRKRNLDNRDRRETRSRTHHGKYRHLPSTPRSPYMDSRATQACPQGQQPKSNRLCDSVSRQESISESQGQLKLAAGVHEGVLTVFVAKAKHLKPKDGGVCDSVVKLCLVPEDCHPTKCKGEVVYDDIHPQYNEKFSIELIDGDKNKRLFIAVWNLAKAKNRSGRSSEFLGCMSFGIKNLFDSSKLVRGWYHLLTETVGRNKHLKVMPRTCLPLAPQGAAKGVGCMPLLSRAAQGEVVTLVVRRGRKGYGFTVLGGSPVVIGRVEEDSPAAAVGLTPDDSIVRINGQNVSRSMADSVAKIVRNSDKQIILDVERPFGSSQPPAAASKQQLQPIEEQNENIPPPPMYPVPWQKPNAPYGLYSTPWEQHREQQKSVSQNPHHQLQALQENRHHHHHPQSSTPMAVAPTYTHNPTTPQNSTYYSPWSRCHMVKAEVMPSPPECSLGPDFGSPPTRRSMPSPCRSDSMSDTTQHSMSDMDTDSSPPHSPDTSLRRSDCPESGIDLGSDSGSYGKTSCPRTTATESHWMGADEHKRQQLVQKLLAAEAEFTRQMQYGIQRFSRPLRHRIISPTDHATLFQNVEKLVAISEYHTQQLQEHSIILQDGSNETYIDSMGALYLPKVQVMGEAYEAYCNGVKCAVRLLFELRDFPEFEEFLQNPRAEKGQPSISAFIQKPLEHIKDVIYCIQKILKLTPTHHQDYSNLASIVEILRQSCTRINENNTRRSKSMSSLASRSTRNTRPASTGAIQQKAPQSNNPSGIASSVDAAVLDVQRRLVFPPHMEAFQLANATRHMIYSGEMLHYVNPACLARLHVVLMSDLVLLTRAAPDSDRLHVLDYPILLTDITDTDFNRPNACEFSLRVEGLNGPEQVWGVRHATLRAPTAELKCTWKNIMEQRISSSKTQAATPDNFV